ncbi:hypothetical protein HK104_010528 [Borealophlyctis nickersoniae]|nr:hypothetical protein HK104_010528 [Borealophlyctis nickersoniae]
MDDVTPYERDRQERIARNRAVLAALGLGAPAPARPAAPVSKRKAKGQSAPKKKKTKRERVGRAKGGEEGREEAEGLRRSRRIAGKVATHRPVHDLEDDNNKEEEEQEWRPPPSSKKASRPASTPRSEPRENVFGPIPGVEGYEVDIDLGAAFTYTGEGGRDLKGTKTNPKNLRTAPQSKDQTLTKGNMALYKSWETGVAVRVVSGFKSEYGPKSGYRYDGLYRVEKAWTEKVNQSTPSIASQQCGDNNDDDDEEDEEDEENYGGEVDDTEEADKDGENAGEETEELGGCGSKVL